MLTLYLVKGFPQYAATSLADAQDLFTALQDPSTNANIATIDRVLQKLPPLTQSDTGLPLVISSIDDAAGTTSSWVTDATQSLAFALGDPSPTTDLGYTQANVTTISGNTRTGTLVLSTQRLQEAVSGSRGMPPRGINPQFLAHLRKANITTGATETVGRFALEVDPGVLLAATNEADTLQTSYAYAYANLAYGYANNAQNYSNLSQTYSNNSNTYAFASLGYSNDSQNYANASRANANLSQGYAQNSQNFANSASGFSNNASNSANTAQSYANPSGVTVLTPGANVSWNMAANVCASLIANQNFNLTITSFTDGGTGILHVKQNASGNWVASSWSATAGNIAWPGNVNPTLTATANYYDLFSFAVHGTTIRGAYVQNFAQ